MRNKLNHSQLVHQRERELRKKTLPLSKDKLQSLASNITPDQI